jgi:hypothetical protein
VLCFAVHDEFTEFIVFGRFGVVDCRQSIVLIDESTAIQTLINFHPHPARSTIRRMDFWGNQGRTQIFNNLLTFFANP